ncbi:Crp/Fnr family transcriptional regulator [Rhizobium sp. SSA_523]|uniref:Crp/Fnr family transcriptional regulator n=1 Tax=Rhizobium sp. SSA_523 TaxID=2952477 RepID=UPI002091795B|nr:Crp/Fnr family transcriptional regulator [Rhizobium sp. SSA_523]MCO5734013.1 Crp/Fnr family transcriptional regulator [Rhizobium sp. SSA_523]WKC24655.1 Crp/Fnr family transcriptional regulator [Rhizobium sp. SSA_523]
MELPKGMQLAQAGVEVDHVYFLGGGIASAVAVSPQGKRAEAGLFGREGFLPLAGSVAGQDAETDIIMQLEGWGWRLSASTFIRLQQDMPDLRELVMRAILAFTAQIAATALSNAVHTVDERLTRWLLMCHDRVDGDEIALTHEFLALMLAVRRPSVTSALHVLEGHGFIRSERGRTTIRNRPAMERFAEDAYGQAEVAYERLMTVPQDRLDLETV